MRNFLFGVAGVFCAIGASSTSLMLTALCILIAGLSIYSAIKWN